METEKIFKELKAILQKYADKLLVVYDKPDNYYLNTLPTEVNKKGDFFGSVQIRKNYVSFHLMPIYFHPELLDNTDAALKKKMQGKSCFNFKNPDETLFAELKYLTETSFEKYQKEGKI